MARDEDQRTAGAGLQPISAVGNIIAVAHQRGAAAAALDVRSCWHPRGRLAGSWNCRGCQRRAHRRARLSIRPLIAIGHRCTRISVRSTGSTHRLGRGDALSSCGDLCVFGPHHHPFDHPRRDEKRSGSPRSVAEQKDSSSSSPWRMHDAECILGSAPSRGSPGQCAKTSYRRHRPCRLAGLAGSSIPPGSTSPALDRKGNGDPCSNPDVPRGRGGEADYDVSWR